MKRVSWMVLMIMTLSFCLAACGETTEEQQPAAETTNQQEEAVIEEPTAEPETAVSEAEAPKAEAPAAEAPKAEKSTDEPAASETNENPQAVGEEAEIPFSDLGFSSLEDLTSYRYDFAMTIMGTDESGAEIEQKMSMILSVSTDPPATSLSMNTEGQNGIEGMENIEFVQVNNTNYIVMGGMGCITPPADDENMLSTSELTAGFTPQSLTENLDKVTLVGEETVNGINTLHYTYNESSLAEEEMAEIDSMTGHLYLAKDGGYMVRSIVDMVGDSKFNEGFASHGTTHIEANLIDVNQAVEIVPPASCEGQGAGASSDWPILEGASDVISFAGVVSYTTGATAEEVIEFYKDALTDLGYTWDETSSFAAEGTGFLFFTHSENLNVSVTISQDGEVTSVIIVPDK